MNETTDLVRDWWRQRVREGVIPSVPGEWPRMIKSALLADDFIQWCTSRGYPWLGRRSAESAFGKAIKSVRVITKFRALVDGAPRWYYRLPQLDEARTLLGVRVES